MKPDDLKSLLEDMGIKPSKARGQCFLIDEEVAHRAVTLAEVEPNDIVLEVGPGLGILTEPLSRRARKVIAIEQDKRLFGYLMDKDFKNTELVNADALKVDFPQFNKIVSNLPYQISSPITLKLLEGGFSSGILMYQREFAERLVEETGRNSSRLSVKLYYKAKTKLIEMVPRSAFYPAPRVDGALVRLTPRAPPFKVEDEELFFRVVDCIYSHRRKKIQNCFRQHWKRFVKNKGDITPLLRELPYIDKRAEELSPEQMGELSNRVYHIYMGFAKD
jgi:16S rRNA (adenine1518-N6/adenine1519-N6)-dimethyltransferase